MKLIGILILMVVFSGTFTYVNNALSKQPVKNADNDIIVRYSPFLIAACISMATTAFAAALLMATLWRQSTLNTNLIFSFIGYGVISLGLGFFYSYGKVIVNTKEIKVIRLFGRNRTYSWNEITHVRYEEENGLQAFCGRKKAFQCANSFSGWEPLVELLRKKKLIKN